MIVPYYLARISRSRGKKHGETQWQQDHWKAMDARRGAGRTQLKSVGTRIKSTEILSKLMDARRILPILGLPHDDRHLLHRTLASQTRVRNTTMLVCNDDDRQAGPMRARRDLESTTQPITVLRQEQGRQNVYFPNWKGTATIGRKTTGRKLPFRHPHNNGGNTNTKTLDGEITIGGMNDG